MKPESSIVLFRVDASSEIGAGHLMRCLALANAFQQAGIRCHFLVNHRTATLLQTLGRLDIEFTEISATESELSQIKACIHHLQQELGLLALVLDGYQFSAEYRCEVKSLVELLVVLDDQNNSGLLYADLVVNPIETAKNLNYSSTAAHAKHTFGSAYVLLQPAFQHVEPSLWEHRRELLITFGASDVKDLSLSVLSELYKRELPFQAVTLVTGAAYPHVEALRQVMASQDQGHLSVKHLHNVADMAQVMQKARLAISAAGSTQFELATLRVPGILVVVADNQLAAAREQESEGWCQVVDARHGLQVAALIQQASDLWLDAERLRQMHQAAGKRTYQMGAHRVVRAVQQCYELSKHEQGIKAYGVVLNAVQVQDLEMIRQWRNDPSVRQFMFDQAEISKEQQQRWYASLCNDISQQHYVIYFKEQAIGVINIKSFDKEPLFQSPAIEIGLYIYAPRYRNNFLAFCPSLAMIDYCFDVLQCEKILASVLPDNQAAINYNRQLGYAMQPENQTDKDVLHMTLEQDDYCIAARKIKSLIRYN